MHLKITKISTQKTVLLLLLIIIVGCFTYLLIVNTNNIVSRDSSVGIATGYGLDGPGI
jgi:hypothetical protein